VLQFIAVKKQGFVYMITTVDHTAIYTGVTSNIKQRYIRHCTKYYPKSFTARYHCSKLVYIKSCPDIMSAIVEEKRIKGGSRKKKVAMITAANPEWKDLGPGLLDDH